MSDTLRLLIANVLSGVGMLLNLVSISMKSKRKMVLVQTFLNFCVSTGQIFARGYAGAVQDGVAMVRNIFVLKGWDKKPVKIFSWRWPLCWALFSTIWDGSASRWWSSLPFMRRQWFPSTPMKSA